MLVAETEAPATSVMVPLELIPLPGEVVPWQHPDREAHVWQRRRRHIFKTNKYLFGDL